MSVAEREPFWLEVVHSTFSALKFRNYRLWFIGQLVSLFGTWMQVSAQGFLVFELTGSSAYLGYVAFAAGLPTWLFMLWGGVVADRVPRRLLLMITQSALMLLAAILALLTFLDLVQPWHILVLAACAGAAGAFDAPARLAFVLEMVDREEMTNAIALNSTMFNTATTLGPAVAGVVYAAAGPEWCFLANAVSYLAVLAALAMMRLDGRRAGPLPSPEGGAEPVPMHRPSALADMKEGLVFVASDRTVRFLILLVVVMSLFGVSFVTLMPAWASRVLHGDATTNGFLQSARGIGALGGALFLAWLGRRAARGRMILRAVFLMPAAVLAFSFVRWLPVSLLFLAVAGVGLIVALNATNSLLQTLAPDTLRGRVMSVYTLAFFGFVPLGGLMIGTLAESWSEPAAVAFNAGLSLAFAAAAPFVVPHIGRLR